jgi:hypothetical protein
MWIKNGISFFVTRCIAHGYRGTRATCTCKLTMQNANGGLDFCWFMTRLQDRFSPCMTMGMRYPSVHEGLVVDRTCVSTVGTIRVGFTIKFPCRRAPAAGCSTLAADAIAEQVHCMQVLLSHHDMHPLAQFVHAASYESIVFSHRPCTGVLVFITVKLNPVHSLHVSDNVKPTCFDELEVHA